MTPNENAIFDGPSIVFASHSLTPARFLQCFRNVHIDTLYRGIVFRNMFATLDARMDKFSDEELVTFMTTEGFLPKPTSEHAVDTLAGMEHIASIELIRHYWDDMLSGANTLMRREVDAVCQKFVNRVTLCNPSKCVSCQWTLPSSEMRNETCCSYCHDRDHSHLTTCGKTVYLKRSKQNQNVTA